MTRSIRLPLLLLAAGGFVSGTSIRIAEPLLPRLAAEFDASLAEASVLITGYTLAYGAFQLLHGPLGDRLGKLRTVCGAMLLAALASAACATAGSLEQLAVYRFLTGMTAGAVIPLSFAFVGDHVPFEQRQPVLGRFISGTLLGITLGPLLGGAFSDVFGWRAAFVTTALAFLLLAILLLPLLRHETVPRGSAPDPLTGYLAVLRSPSARTTCLVVALEGALLFGGFGYLGALLRLEHGLGYTHIGLVLAGFGIGGIAYSLLVTVLVRRVGPRRMVLAGGGILLASFAAVALAPDWRLVAPAIVTLGLGYYLIHNTLQTRATEMVPSARGAAISAFAFCLFGGQALGVFLAGRGVEAVGFTPVLLLAGFGLAVLAIGFARSLEGG